MQNPEIDAHIQQQSSDAQEWLVWFVNHMRAQYPEFEEVISFQMPTFKLGSGNQRNYVAMSVAAKHCSLHSMDFEVIAALHETLKKSGNGKGCVNVPYGDMATRPLLEEAIANIVRRNAEMQGI